jgi:hypothetical protein
LEVTLASSATPVIDAHTDHGEVRSDFPVQQKGADTSSDDETAPVLTLKNDFGDVTIREL